MQPFIRGWTGAGILFSSAGFPDRGLGEDVERIDDGDGKVAVLEDEAAGDLFYSSLTIPGAIVRKTQRGRLP